MYDKKKAQESLRKEYKVVNEKSDKMYDDWENYYKNEFFHWDRKR